MKKYVSVALVGLALTFLLAYSSNSIAVENGKNAVPYNGITYFELGRQPVSTEGSAAGGLGEISSSKETFNGITFFDKSLPAAKAKGSETGESRTPNNGITVFK